MVYNHSVAHETWAKLLNLMFIIFVLSYLDWICLDIYDVFFHEDLESVKKNAKKVWDRGPTWSGMSIFGFKAILYTF